jgi:AraC-like DNA-binding protein
MLTNDGHKVPNQANMMLQDQNLHWRMPAAYLKVFLQHAASEHLPVQMLLDGTGLEAEELMQSDLSVSFLETRQVLANVTRILGADWHLSLAQRLTIPSHGPLGFAAVTAPDLRASVNVLLRFFGIRGPFLWLAGAVENDQFVIRIYETTELGDERNALVELAVLAIQGMIERPLGRELLGARIALAYPAPAYVEKLDSAFHPELEFNASGHKLSFPAAWLNEPCILYDEAMHRYLLMRCEEDMRAVSGILPAEIAIRQALLARPDQLPGLVEVAAAQNISPRTLIRRLKRANTSYSAILEDVRKTLAVDYLLRSGMSVSSIAYRLGYRDPSNFGRAFRAWFGVSPGRYRAENTGS